MYLSKNDAYEVALSFGFVFLGVGTILLTPYIYNFIGKKITNFFFIDFDNGFLEIITETIINETKMFILNSDDYSNVVNFINSSFLKELILISQKNISSHYYALTSNEGFFNLIKIIFDVEKNKTECLATLTNSFDEFSLNMFFEDLKKSKNVGEFRKIKKNERVLFWILDFLTKKYNIK